jgi:hypothetical protein
MRASYGAAHRRTFDEIEAYPIGSFTQAHLPVKQAFVKRCDQCG